MSGSRQGRVGVHNKKFVGISGHRGHTYMSIYSVLGCLDGGNSRMTAPVPVTEMLGWRIDGMRRVIVRRLFVKLEPRSKVH